MPDAIDFDSTIVQVSCESGQTEPGCCSPGKEPVPHALDDSTDKIPYSFVGRVGSAHMRPQDQFRKRAILTDCANGPKKNQESCTIRRTERLSHQRRRRGIGSVLAR